MPVRLRSRCSISAIHLRPFCEALRIWSNSELKPGRMMPPSARLRGGSSTMACSMSVIISSLSVRRCTRRSKESLFASSERHRRISAAERRPFASAIRSRGVAIRWRTRLIRRSTSPAFLSASARRACSKVSSKSSAIVV